MRLYEGMFLLDSNLVNKDWAGLETHLQDILKKNRAEVLYSEKWPDRRLAYEVKGCKKGTYFLAYFNAPPDAIREIYRDSELSERILRVLIIQEKGLEREMERRKNREITAPPSELSFEDDRYESRDFGYGPRRRSESFAETKAEVLSKESTEKLPEEVSPESEGEVPEDDSPSEHVEGT